MTEDPLADIAREVGKEMQDKIQAKVWLDEDGEKALRIVLGYVNAGDWLPLSVREAVKALGSKMPEPLRLERDEPDSELLARMGTDAELWADEFSVRAGALVDLSGSPLADTDGFLVAWFANAIEAGRSAGRSETSAYINELEVRLGINQGD